MGLARDTREAVALNYTEPWLRDLEEIASSFGRGTAQAISDLQPGDVYIDAGTGFGLIPFEAAARNVRAVGLSVQDFWKPFEAFAELKPQDLGLFEEGTHQANVGYFEGPYRNGLDPRTLAGLLDRLDPEKKHTWHTSTSILGVSGMPAVLHTAWWRSPNAVDRGATAERIRDTVGRVVAERKRLEASGNFRYVVERAQDYFPTVPAKSVKLVTDLYGATHYSVDKLELLREYYRVLQADGKASVLLGHMSRFGPNPSTPDWVDVGGGKLVPLHQYLVVTYPKIFSFKKYDVGLHHTVVMLEIKRDPAVDTLDFGLAVDPKRLVEDPLHRHRLPERVVYHRP
jgi:SAM-dependent methyltransferase